MDDFESIMTARYRTSMRLALVASTLWIVMPAASVEAKAPAGESAGLSGHPDTSSDRRLRIEISPTINDADLLHRWIVKRSLDVVKAKVPILERNEQWVAVEIGGTTYDYRVAAVAMRDGELVGSVGEPVTCVCNSDELLALVDERITAAAEELRIDSTISEVVPPPPPKSEPPVGSGSHEPLRSELQGSQPNEQRRRLGALGYSGIGVSVLGASALGTGIALILRSDEWDPSGSTPVRYTTRPPGVAMVAGGGAAFAAGTVMLVVDLVRRRDRSTSFSPMAGPQHVGLSITGRF